MLLKPQMDGGICKVQASDLTLCWCWDIGLQPSRCDPSSQGSCPLLLYLSELLDIRVLYSCFLYNSFRLTAPILLSPLSLQITAPKLCFWTIHWGAHLATSSFLSSDFFSLALYPQKGIALFWHNFSMTDPFCSHLFPSVFTPWLLDFPFSFLVTYWSVRICSFILLLVWAQHSSEPWNHFLFSRRSIWRFF